MDASVALASCFDDESTAAIDSVMLRAANEGAVVPSLWRYEVANGLLTAVRRKRIDPSYRDRMLDRLGQLDITVDAGSEDHVWGATVQLAALHGLTIYDAAYLELSQRRRLALATLDAALANAAKQTGVDVVP